MLMKEMIKIMSHLVGALKLKNVLQSLFSQCELVGKGLLFRALVHQVTKFGHHVKLASQPGAHPGD